MRTEDMRTMRNDIAQGLESLTRVISVLEAGEGGPFATRASQEEQRQYRADRLADYTLASVALKRQMADIDEALARDDESAT